MLLFAYTSIVLIFLGVEQCDCVCNGQVDVIFLIDGSLRLNQSEFYGQKYFIGQMLQFFHLNDSSDTRLAVIRQSGSSSVKINLQSGYSSRHFKIVLSSIEQSKEPAHNLTNGLLLMQEVFRANKRIGVPQIGIIFVVGKSQDATQVMQVAESLLSDEVILFAIGTKQTGKEFPAIVGQDNCKLFSIGNFMDMTSLVPYLAGRICIEMLGTTLPNSIKPSCQIYLPVYEKPEFLCPSIVGIYPDPKSRNSFYICDMWTPYQYFCDDTNSVNAAQNICDFDNIPRSN